jgi:hypothetical protein
MLNQELRGSSLCSYYAESAAEARDGGERSRLFDIEEAATR